MQIVTAAQSHSTAFQGAFAHAVHMDDCPCCGDGRSRFGYDWVVIGGAKPFYEVFFQLTSAAEVG